MCGLKKVDVVGIFSHFGLKIKGLILAIFIGGSKQHISEFVNWLRKIYITFEIRVDPERSHLLKIGLRSSEDVSSTTESK